MNTGISTSYPSSHSLSENHLLMPQSIGDEENSIISWYHHAGNDYEDECDIVSVGNSEDFIDIDMLPDTHETMEKATDNRTVDPIRVRTCLINFKEILLLHRRIFRNNSKNVINRNLNEKERIAIVKSKSGYTESLGNTLNICCYNEGLSALLQIFNRVDCFVQQFSVTINDCRCSKKVGRSYISQIRYALEAGGDKCLQCSMDYILENLNTKFLANVARAQFFTVKEIIDSITVKIDEEIELGATSSTINCHSNDIPETGWLRKWILKNVNNEAVVAIMYSDTDENYYNSFRNKFFFRIVDFYTDEEFHLTIPMESVKDQELERRLLLEEKAYVLRSDMQNHEHRAEEFEYLMYHSDDRVHDMNVLGQIVGMFREQTVENFRDVTRPTGIHKIKVPSMHRSGVMVVLPLSTTLPDRDIITDDPS